MSVLVDQQDETLKHTEAVAGTVAQDTEAGCVLLSMFFSILVLTLPSSSD